MENGAKFYMHFPVDLRLETTAAASSQGDIARERNIPSYPPMFPPK